MYSIEAYDMREYPSITARLKGTGTSITAEWVGISLPRASLRLKVDNLTSYTHFKMTLDNKVYVFQTVGVNSIGALSEYALEVDYLKTFFAGSTTGYTFHALRSGRAADYVPMVYDPSLPLSGDVNITVTDIESVLSGDYSLYLVMANVLTARGYGVSKAVNVIEIKKEAIATFNYKVFNEAINEVFTSNVIRSFTAPATGLEATQSVLYVNTSGSYSDLEVPCVYITGDLVPQIVTIVHDISDYTHVEPITTYKVFIPLFNDYVDVSGRALAEGYDQIMLDTHYADGTIDVWQGSGTLANFKKLKKLASGTFPSVALVTSAESRAIAQSGISFLTSTSASMLAAATGNVAGAAAGVLGSAGNIIGTALNSMLQPLNASGSFGQFGGLNDRTVKLIKTVNTPLETPEGYAVNHGYYLNKDIDELYDGYFYVCDEIPRIKGPMWLVDGINQRLMEGFIY